MKFIFDGIKNILIMFFMCILSIFQVVWGSYEYELNSTKQDSSQTHLEALDHVNDFLKDIQKKLQHGQRIINNIANEGLLGDIADTLNRTNESAIMRRVSVPRDGYFSESFVRFFKLTVTKDPEDVMKVLKPGKAVAVAMFKNGELKLMKGQIAAEFFKFLQTLHYQSYDSLKIYLANLRHSMQYRHILLDYELNELINNTNSLIDDEDGENMLKAIDEFEAFPRLNKTGEELCRDILKAFLRPFQKKMGTKELKRLIFYASGSIALQKHAITEKKDTLRSVRISSLNHLAELDHVNNMLEGIQQQIRKGQNIIRRMNVDIQNRSTAIPSKFVTIDTSKNSGTMNGLKQPPMVAVENFNRDWSHNQPNNERSAKYQVKKKQLDIYQGKIYHIDITQGEIVANNKKPDKIQQGDKKWGDTSQGDKPQADIYFVPPGSTIQLDIPQGDEIWREKHPDDHAQTDALPPLNEKQHSDEKEGDVPLGDDVQVDKPGDKAWKEMYLDNNLQGDVLPGYILPGKKQRDSEPVRDEMGNEKPVDKQGDELSREKHWEYDLEDDVVHSDKPSDNNHQSNKTEGDEKWEYKEGKVCFICDSIARLFEQIAMKNDNHLRIILKNIKKVKDIMMMDGKLNWMGHFKQLISDLLVDYFLFTTPKVLKKQAAQFHHNLKSRNTTLSPDINQALEFADDFLSQSDGERLSKAITEFQAFPRVNKTGEMVCRNVISAFSAPFQKAQKSILFQNLLDDVYPLLHKEYPNVLGHYDLEPMDVYKYNRRHSRVINVTPH